MGYAKIKSRLKWCKNLSLSNFLKLGQLFVQVVRTLNLQYLLNIAKFRSNGKILINSDNSDRTELQRIWPGKFDENSSRSEKSGYQIPLKLT